MNIEDVCKETLAFRIASIIYKKGLYLEHKRCIPLKFLDFRIDFITHEKDYTLNIEGASCFLKFLE